MPKNRRPGRPPIPGFEQVHLNLPEPLLGRLRAEAAREQRTLSATVARHLEAATAPQPGAVASATGSEPAPAA